jgi:hypothetical protein
VIESAYSFFIKIGEPNSESILIDTLTHAGDSDMAIGFLYCGNSHLERAAQQWLTAHGISISNQNGVIYFASAGITVQGLQEIEWVVLRGHSTGSMHGYWLSGAWSAFGIRHDEA